uniref:Uncharacterized protein n=1 Tax=Anguilla anguilla TaxID=7936 RepID=A0A0E9PGV8_ANGAN
MFLVFLQDIFKNRFSLKKKKKSFQ